MAEGDEAGDQGTKGGASAPSQSVLTRFSAAWHKGISDFFEALGRFVYRRPRVVIAATVALAVLGLVLFIGLFEQELDGDQLFTPDSSRAFDDREYVEMIYGEPNVQTRVLVTRDIDVKTEPDCSKRDLLVDPDMGKAFLLEVFDLYESILKIRVEEDGEDLGLEDICVKPVADGPCRVESVLDAWDYNRTALLDDSNVTATLNRDDLTTQFGLPLDVPFVVGRNREGGECNGTVEVYQFQFILQWERRDVDGEDIDPRTRKWLEELVDVVRDDWSSDTLVGYVSNIEAIDNESDKAVDRDVLKLSVGYVLILLYTHVVLFKNSPVFNKSHLALLSALSVGMAIITAFGLAQLFKIKFNLVVQTLPFLLLGLGTDDTFVIVGAYHQTDAALPGEDRIAQAMRAAGSSILVTSVTDMVAFLMGSYTELPALRAFSAYATLGIIFDFFYQVTFFLACLALDTKREKRAYNGAPRWGFQCCCLGSWCGSDQYNEGQFVKAVLPESTKDLEKGQAEGLAAATVVAGDGKRDPNRKIFGAGSYDPSAPSFATKLVGEWIPKYTLSPVGKAIVIVAECGLLAMAIYGSTKVFMDFQFRDWFTPDGSWLKDAFEVEDRYFSGDSTAFEVYTKEPPADRPSYYHFQDDLVRLVDELRANDKFVTDNPPVSSWYESFCNSVEPGQMSCANSSQLTPDNFDFQVFQFINSNDSTEGRFFNGRVIFEPPVCSTADDCQIISSRIDGQSQDVVDGQFAVDLVDSLRDTAKAAIPDLDPIAYNPVFLFYDGFRVIAWETVRNVLMAGVAVFVMSLIVLSNFFAGLAVLAMVAATDVMLFGWMHYVDLQFNTVTAINMVLAVGIAVDYSAHITHSFLVVKGTRDERAKAALFRIGGEVLAGAFTTFLAVAVMGAAEHYIFQVFFKMFAAIIMFGIWHGVIVLPVMLSILGPVAYEDVAKQ